jgi:hypothetical protein
MAAIDPHWLEYRRKYFIRPNGNVKPRANAHLSIRHDAWRFMPPGSPRYVRKDVVRYFWPDHGRTEETDGREHSGPAEAAADLAGLLSLKRKLDVVRAELKFRRVYADIMGRLRALRDGEVSKAFNPNQQRVPAGSRGGGQWRTVRAAALVATIPASFLTLHQMALDPAPDMRRRVSQAAIRSIYATKKHVEVTRLQNM